MEESTLGLDFRSLSLLSPSPRLPMWPLGSHCFWFLWQESLTYLQDTRDCKENPQTCSPTLTLPVLSVIKPNPVPGDLAVWWEGKHKLM